MVKKNSSYCLAYKIIIESENKALKDRSLPIINQVLSLDFGDQEPISKFAEGYLKWFNKGDLLDAAQDITEGLELEEDSIFGKHTLATIYSDLKDWSSSVLVAERLGVICSEYTSHTGITLEQVEVEAQMLVGTGHLEIGDKNLVQALSTFKSILHNHPNYISALMGMGLSLRNLKKFGEAKVCFEKVLEQVPAFWDAKIELAWTVFHLGSIDEARSFLEEAKNVQESSIVLYRLACIYWEMRGLFRTDKQYTHSHLVQAIKLNPNLSSSFTLLGHFYFEMESDIVRAEKCFMKAIAINPKDEDAVNSLCDLHLDQGNVSDAKNLVEQFVSFCPRSFWAWNQLGIIHLVRAI